MVGHIAALFVIEDKEDEDAENVDNKGVVDDQELEKIPPA